jgi:predicted nucleotidyltransferase
MKTHVTSITSVSKQAIKQREDLIRYKLGLSTAHPLITRRHLLPRVLEYREDIKQIAMKYGVERIWVIGSVAEDTDTNMSDLDVFVYTMDMSRYQSFTYELAEFMGVPVDVFVEGKDGRTWDNYIADYGHVEL